MSSPSKPPSSKRSLEARRRRSRNSKARARENARLSPYLLPQPCVSDISKLDCVAVVCTLASVAIVNRDCECVYEAFVQPPRDRPIDPRSRRFCPVTDQQFAIARCTPGTAFDDVRREVLAILQR